VATRRELPPDEQSIKEGTLKKAVTLIAVAAATGLLAASASAANVHKHVRYVKLVVEQGFFVDNDPSGQSGGDLFGSTGVLRHRNHQVGTFSAACESSSADGGQCNVSFVWNSGDRLQLAGEIQMQGGAQSRIAIVGGTGKYKQARGDATVTPVDDQGQVQRIKLRILR
jgi:hypothetical protein